MMNTKLVGILNITPDSFSDGGKYLHPKDAVGAIERLLIDGADVIDVGAESTRPGATPLTHEQEWARLEPVLQSLDRFAGATFSLDTRHAQTARKALSYPISWINDVSGFSDPAMVEAVKHSAVKLVVMHSLGVPADKAIVLSESVDAVQEILDFAQRRIASLESAGIARERIIFDPGIGFGKTPKQSWEIIHNIRRFSVLEIPLFVGHSRKSFLSRHPREGGDPFAYTIDPRVKPEDDNINDRDAATLDVSRDLARQGVAYLRVHDVAGHRRMLAHEN